jgi:ADP-ribose pyrophosphatase YjhB (NUDIX family)
MKIPDHATRVFKGKIFDVYQWEEEMYDGTKGIWERIKRPATVQILPVAGDKIYLSYEEQPRIPLGHHLFGGRVEEEEDPLVAAKRELLEEAGMESNDWELIKEYNDHGSFDWPVYVYVARNCQKVAEQKLDAGERIEIQEYDFDEFLRIGASEEFGSPVVAGQLFRISQDPQKKAAFKHLLLKK